MFYVIIMGHRVCEQEKKVCIKHKYHNKTVPMLYFVWFSPQPFLEISSLGWERDFEYY